MLATDEAFSNATLATLAGSITPADIKSSYLSVAALYPTADSLFNILSIIISPFLPAFSAIVFIGDSSAFNIISNPSFSSLVRSFYRNAKGYYKH